MSAKVQVLTLLSELHKEQGRFAVSFDVVQKKKSEDVKKSRKLEAQVYVEDKSVIGGCSPEMELPLKERKCDIQMVISGALKPQSDFDEGEDIIEYSESLSECRKLLALVPTYDEAAEGNATIKFKVQGKVKHTVTIHDVPTTKDLNRSTSSSSSFVEFREAGASRQTSIRSTASTVSDISMEQSMSIDEGSVVVVPAPGTVHENVVSSSGEGHRVGSGAQAVPDPPRPLVQGMGNMAIRQQGPDVVPPEEPNDFGAAYGKILSNESLSTLAWTLSPSDANRLLIGLSVPDQIHAQNQKNHQGDVVTGNYESLRYWRNQRKGRTQQHEVSHKQLYEDLLCELDDIGRKDIKVVIKATLENNKKLEKNDFSHL